MANNEIKLQMPAYNRCIHLTVNDTSRFEGSGSGVGFGVGTDGPGMGVGVGGVSGNIISKKEMDFYPGLEIGDVIDEKFKPMFRDLDCIEPDGKLSEEEIEQYMKYYQQKTEYENKRDKTSKKMLWGGVGASVAGGLACLTSQTSKLAKGIGIGMALGGWALIIAGLIKGCAKSIDSEKYPYAAGLDGQYSHISEAKVS